MNTQDKQHLEWAGVQADRGDEMNVLDALAQTRKTWPAARLRTARKAYFCDNDPCGRVIESGQQYIDPGDSNPDRAGGFGGYRYCLNCAGGNSESSST